MVGPFCWVCEQKRSVQGSMDHNFRPSSSPLDKGDLEENWRQLRRFQGHRQRYSLKDRSVMGKNPGKI